MCSTQATEVRVVQEHARAAARARDARTTLSRYFALRSCAFAGAQLRAETFWLRQQVDWTAGSRPARPGPRYERCGGEDCAAPQARGSAWEVWAARALAMYSIARRRCARGAQNIFALKQS